MIRPGLTFPVDRASNINQLKMDLVELKSAKVGRSDVTNKTGRKPRLHTRKSELLGSAEMRVQSSPTKLEISRLWTQEGFLQIVVVVVVVDCLFCC